MKFPSIADVARALRNANATIDRAVARGDVDDQWVDVRLQVWPDGTWALHLGPSDYDQDHRGFWGASSLCGRRFDSRAMAKDLIEQAREMHACDVSEAS